MGKEIHRKVIRDLPYMSRQPGEVSKFHSKTLLTTSSPANTSCPHLCSCPVTNTACDADSQTEVANLKCKRVMSVAPVGSPVEKDYTARDASFRWSWGYGQKSNPLTPGPSFSAGSDLIYHQKIKTISKATTEK